jgi:hypothetical protein
LQTGTGSKTTRGKKKDPYKQVSYGLGFQTHQDFVECMNLCFHLESVVVKIHEEVLEDWFTKNKETIGMDISIFLREEGRCKVLERGQERHAASNIRAWHERLE